MTTTKDKVIALLQKQIAEINKRANKLSAKDREERSNLQSLIRETEKIFHVAPVKRLKDKTDLSKIQPGKEIKLMFIEDLSLQLTVHDAALTIYNKYGIVNVDSQLKILQTCKVYLSAQVSRGWLKNIKQKGKLTIYCLTPAQQKLMSKRKKIFAKK